MKKGIISTALAGVVSGAVGSAVAAYVVNKNDELEIQKIKKSKDKFKSYYDVTRQWMMYCLEGKSTNDYLEKKGYQNVAIYGAGTMGDLICAEMKENKSKIRFFIEQTGVPVDDFIDDISLRTMEGEIDFTGVDAVIVSAITYFDEIYDALIEKGCTCDIISLEDVIYEL